MNKLRILLEIFLVSTRLGLTSFGGPTAHLGYFHAEYVGRKKWMSEKSYADLVALSQFLPGPASSQVGIGVGVMRGGVLGGLTSFIGFTLPSVIVLMIFASLMTTFDISEAGWIHGLKIVAVVIVLHAILGMSKNLTPDIERKVIALFALVATLLFQSVFTQIGVILIAAVIGFILFKDYKDDGQKSASFPIKKSFSAACLVLFFVLLFVLPAFRELTGSYWVAVIDSFYRAGALVFGGGHVVLPLLEQELVPTGWITEEAFLAGYGATQAVPGPLFTFAAYLGTVMNGWFGGLIATAAIFLPAFLLILGALPFWDMLRNNEKIKGAVMGVNAAVIGILISALYTPIWTSSILKPADFALAAILFVMLLYFKLPPWVIVVTGGAGGMLIGFL
ncbi:chromate efflux transporter [Jeotgalicoccus halotolerans]|uniref:Chromate transporter n=1 Tax=Jeotgalicoccus halotolerans TaxID=157227 RepID=A0A3E0B1K8_9STAP|nr:chromate efflux transporter [Jeotgalicoccus halotolerans]REG25804.1 chromate transporter [Jeotgalicoccus halotolerans]